MNIEKKTKVVVESIDITLSETDRIALRRVAGLLDDIHNAHWDSEVLIDRTFAHICRHKDSGAYLPKVTEMDYQDVAYLLRKMAEYKE